MSDETTPDPDLLARFTKRFASRLRAWPEIPDSLATWFAESALQVVQPEIDRRDARIEELQATLARVKELALMGGQDPILVRQWIVIEIDQHEATRADQAGQGSADAGGPPEMLSISKEALLGLFSCAFMGDEFLMTHGQLREITALLGDDAVIPRRTEADQPAEEDLT